MAAADLELDDTVQHVDVRIYFDVEVDPETFKDDISETLQASNEMAPMVAAYALDERGYPEEKPLA